jgi:glycerol-3-phosphate dehydrogenase
MFRTDKRRAVIGSGAHGSALGDLLLPNGEYAVILDRDVYRSALRAADQRFSEALKELTSNGIKINRQSAA